MDRSPLARKVNLSNGMPGFQTNASENIAVDIGGHRFNWLAVKQQKSNYCN